MSVTAHGRELLLRHVPEDGKAVGNTALRRALGWSEDRFWAVRNTLIDEDVLERGRGQGGSVRRILGGHVRGFDEPTELAVGEAAIVSVREAELYGPMRDVIMTGWASEHQVQPIGVVVTAAQGRRATGGRWTRPDIVSIAVKTFRYVPGKYVEVVTFEVKQADSADVTVVFEALAHRRSATHAYVLLHVPDERPEQVSTIDEICRVARSHGIGVILAIDPREYSTWDEREEAVRHEPDPQVLDDFIATQLPAEVKDRLSRALR